MMAMLFMVGRQIIIQDQINYRKGLIVGVSFMAGTGFQSGAIFADSIRRPQYHGVDILSVRLKGQTPESGIRG